MFGRWASATVSLFMIQSRPFYLWIHRGLVSKYARYTQQGAVHSISAVQPRSIRYHWRESIGEKRTLTQSSWLLSFHRPWKPPPLSSSEMPTPQPITQHTSSPSLLAASPLFSSDMESGQCTTDQMKQSTKSLVLSNDSTCVKYGNAR
ncbi:hypothetical protein PDE_00250 [Penicillium oxalicum 114-2]|uniref:Uncharacterized protein n=1 Tax=Penicillium oxalicum (strain 114-2 / CGMCC 5302) TaxID=933388 RepID=S8AU21_PENO1|nr:hypothetical protein PDE_00250 [Penicillium oxalicum 114-2]